MRLIDAEMIKMPTSMMHNIGGCYMIRVEDVQRLITEQPTAFDKEKVLKELKGEIELTVHNPMIAGRYIKKSRAVEIIEKGGI